MEDLVRRERSKEDLEIYYQRGVSHYVFFKTYHSTPTLSHFVEDALW